MEQELDDILDSNNFAKDYGYDDGFAGSAALGESAQKDLLAFNKAVDDTGSAEESEMEMKDSGRDDRDDMVITIVKQLVDAEIIDAVSILKELRDT